MLRGEPCFLGSWPMRKAGGSLSHAKEQEVECLAPCDRWSLPQEKEDHVEVVAPSANRIEPWLGAEQDATRIWCWRKTRLSSVPDEGRGRAMFVLYRGALSLSYIIS